MTKNYIGNADTQSSSNVIENCFSNTYSSYGKYVNSNYIVTSTRETLLTTLNNYSSENGLYKWGYIKHNVNGGSAVENRMSFLTYIDPSLSTPTKVGNTFGGWYTNYGLTKPWSERSTVKVFSSYSNVHAKWNVNSYNLSFDTREGSLVENRSVKFNDLLNLTEPTKEGMIFYDWYELKSNGEEALFREVRMPARDVTLVATWGTISRHKISFNTTGGTEIPSLKYAENDTIDLQNVTEPEKLGHVFVHWYLEGESSDSEFNLTTMPGSDIVLCAKWELDSYELTFYGRENQTLDFGEQIPNETAERDCYEFVYWYEEDPSTPFNLTEMPARDLVLYPLFEPILYTLTLEFDNGETQYQDNFVCCKRYVLPTPSKDGYTFSHWYEEDIGPSTHFDSAEMPTRSITLYAKWTPICYALSFDSTGGSTVENVTFCSGETVSLPPNTPKKAGYAFEYWYEDNETVPFNFTVMPFRDVTLHAMWSNVSLYVEITFDRKYTVEEIKEEIQKISGDFVIMEFNSDQESTKIIIKFNDENASREFVRSVEGKDFFKNAKIDYVGHETYISFKKASVPMFTGVLYCYYALLFLLS